MTYRKSRIGVYPLHYGWGYAVVAPDGTRVTAGGFDTEVDARKAAQRSGRFYDKLERDQVDGIGRVRTDRVLERGVRICSQCGKPHDRVAVTRRGKPWGSTWAAPDGHSYHGESWESFARRNMAEAAA